MSTNQTRNYNCKDEELPVIGGYVAFSLKRDLPDFSGYSPLFNEDYVVTFDAKITAATDLVSPKSEIAERKVITHGLYAQMDGLIDPVNHLEGYIKLAKTDIPISVADFGIRLLREKVKNKDAEGTLQSLRLIESNIQKYDAELAAKGMTNDLPERFEAASIAITEGNQKQYVMLQNRKKLVQDNLYILNDLFRQTAEICDIGKILYKQNDPEKKQEYTFSYLVKQVRHVSKAKSNGEK
jgi:hypothetical protein